MTEQCPAAWANEDDDGVYEVGLSEAHAHYVLERSTNGKYAHRNPRIVPLYRQPQHRVVLNVKETDMSDLVPPMMPEDLDALIQAMERVQQLEAEVARMRLTDEEREAIAWIALTHSRLKCEGHRPGRTKEMELDAVWGFLDRTK